MEKEALWRKVIKSKYHMADSDWIPKMELNIKVSPVWKDIMLVQTRQPLIHSNYLGNLGFKVGNGHSILFWKDEWLNKPSLALSFPVLFRTICNKEETHGEVIQKKSTSQKWEFQFRRRLYDWEITNLNELKELLNGSGVLWREECADTLIWKGDSSNVFSVKSMYGLSRVTTPNSNSAAVFDLIWNNATPYRIQCFGWMVGIGRVKTAELSAKAWNFTQP